ncbi:hypothetical protein [Bacillus sp. ISL-55]|uniref:hypothetical protein n=1 Tax=Bacillus sp. ISL-55 TaxID=2819134 RepID=UPI001BEAECC3|nr:hypothetical protein [Bacillus sp. ISL-55]MBT2692560.1 hypothetical protein [Bacillus sp. ISL-55]
MKGIKILLLTSLIVFLSACGANNDTPMEAAKTFMKSLVEGDLELNTEVNHSDLLSYPPFHMIDIANDRNLVGKSLGDFTFAETDDPKVILVTWEEEGETKEWKLKFNQEKEGYFFVDKD